MAQATGTVAQVSTKTWGPDNILLYSFQLTGNGDWFRTGRNQPPFAEGASISFNYSDDGKRNVDLKTVAPAAGGGAQPAAMAQPAASPTPTRPTTTKNDYWDNKDKYDKEVRQPAIEWQAARNAAISLVAIMAQSDSLPGVTASSKPAKRAEIIESTVDHYTQKFAADLPHLTNNDA